MTRVPVKPELLHWALERAGLSREALVKRFPKLDSWLDGELHPTLKQLEAFAHRTRAPVGYFFLDEPPVETLPIPDYRTMGSQGLRRPSPDLLDTLNTALERQDWYRDFARANREEARNFVGTMTIQSSPVEAARSIRDELDLDRVDRRALKSWQGALRHLIQQAEAAGVLVMCSGVVGNNTSRPLDPEEFRGFALVDDLAPLVFINGRDTKAARMFTLAHELAHLWLGRSALSDAQIASFELQETEIWCNAVAAEVLVPLSELRDEGDANPRDRAREVSRLARYFKVSTLVIIRRMHDAGWISRDRLWVEYRKELARLKSMSGSSTGGGDFYRTQPLRLSRRFATSVVVSALSGQTLFSDAFRLLGVKKLDTFKELGRERVRFVLG